MLNRVKSVYEHKGWVGDRFESDFESKWGLIKQSEIYDGRSVKRAEGIRAAREQGFGFALLVGSLGSIPRLYRITKTSAKDIEAILQYNKVKAVKCKDEYREIERRIRQMVRAAKSRSKARHGIVGDADEDDILRRVLVGKCEVTGIDLDLTTIGQAPFSPSLDQILPGRGYMQDNVQVTCFIYNAMKRDFSADAVREFLEKLRCVP